MNLLGLGCATAPIIRCCRSGRPPAVATRRAEAPRAKARRVKDYSRRGRAPNRVRNQGTSCSTAIGELAAEPTLTARSAKPPMRQGIAWLYDN